ncbi:MAG: sugar ABC transporter substrate-binding protein [Clostridiales bacterium]|jgi:ribose transport system substrate-binding protein|nr:sugar ABC transporter substrate-binding protein [Clostridiales bacterium]
MRYRLSAHIALIIVFSLVLSGCSSAKTLDIAIILSSDSQDFNNSILQGAKAAAEEMDIRLTYKITAKGTSISKQAMFIDSLAEDGIDALVIYPLEYQKINDKLEELNIPVAVINSLPTSEIDGGKNSYLYTDPVETGEIMAYSFIEKLDRGSQIAAILPDMTNSIVMEQLDTMKKILAENNIYVVEVTLDSDDTLTAYKEISTLIMEHPYIKAIAAFDPIVVEGGAEAIGQQNRGIFIVSADASITTVNYLEKGIVETAIIQSPYSIGYLGVQNAMKMANGDNVPHITSLKPRRVTQENLFDPDIENLIFPFQAP